MWTEEKLNELLTKPSAALVEDMKKIKGDIMVLGAGGKRFTQYPAEATKSQPTL